MDPDDRGATLAHELVHVDRRNQRVVDHDDGGARRLEGARDEARVGLVQAMPVPAVHEHVDRGGPVARGEDIEALAGMRAVGEVQPAVERGARLGAGDRVPREPIGAVGDLLAVVVLGVERLLVVLAKHTLGHHPAACLRA